MEIISTGRADEPFNYKEELIKYNNVIITKEDRSYDDSKSLIDSIVPSKDMREYHEKLNYTYDDYITAALISWSNMPYFRKLDELKKLRAGSVDENLIKQLDEYIDYMEYSFKSLKFNEDKEYIYKLSAQWSENGDYEEVGYFVNYEDALDFSNRIVEVNKSIDKIWTVKSKKDYVDIEDDYINDSGGSVSLAKDGTILYCWAHDVPEPPIEDKTFHSSYIPIPYPFRQGDVVRILCDNNRLGIVHGCKTDEEIEQEYEKHKDHFDYSDYQVVVESYYYNSTNDNFGWGHQHISPLNLEFVEIDRKNIDEGSEENLMLAASYLVKGKEVLWGLEYVESMYRKKIRKKREKND